MERISGRNEELQPHETSEFLKKLQESYVLVCQLLKTSNIHFIDTNNKPLETIIGEMVNSIKQINNESH